MTLDKESNLIGKTIQNNFNLKGNMKNEIQMNQLLDSLSKSKFRASFHLNQIQNSL